MAKSKRKRKKKWAKKPIKEASVVRQRDKRYSLPKGLALLPYITNEDYSKKKNRRFRARDKPIIRINNKDAIKTIRTNNKDTIQRALNTVVGSENLYPDTFVHKVCTDRRKRRQILFSKRKAGKGRSGPKKRRYNEKSKVRC